MLTHIFSPSAVIPLNMRASIFRTVGLCAGLVNAFSMDVHNQIAFMAEEYLTPQARWLTQQILEPWYNGSIGRAAAWADIVAHTSHKYSYTWHFIDALDDVSGRVFVYITLLILTLYLSSHPTSATSTTIATANRMAALHSRSPTNLPS